MANATAVKKPAKPMTKSEIVSGIADATGLKNKDVSSVFEAMAAQIKKSLGRSGPGAYVVPGLMKLVVVRKPATKARAAYDTDPQCCSHYSHATGTLFL